LKKIATITFHASHNYGSCLQAYALQEYVKKLHNNECEYGIVNLRTDIQKDIYINVFKGKGLKNALKRMALFNHKKEIYAKEKHFEDFIENKLHVTKEYSTLEQLKNEKWDYDYYIAGSDQLWNIRTDDFDWAYYLEFVESTNKISYSASFGPREIIWNDEEKSRMVQNLSKFKNISVREKGSFNNIKSLIGKTAEINVDPTMLLTKEDWSKIVDKNRLYKDKYIFLYNLKGAECTKLAKKISDTLKLPIVISRPGKLEIIYGFEKRYDCGPCEFLNLIKNAEIVLSSSFHGTIFSILFNKPFFALNGAKDLRINALLKTMGLEERTIDSNDYIDKCKKAFEIDFTESEKLLEGERKKSEKYLKKALDIK